MGIFSANSAAGNVVTFAGDAALDPGACAFGFGVGLWELFLDDAGVALFLFTGLAVKLGVSDPLASAASVASN